MFRHKFSSPLLLIIGAIFFLFGTHMANEISRGEAGISSANGRGRPTLGPVRRHAKERAYDNQQQRIGSERQLLAKSEATANWLRGIGIVLFVAGLGVMIYNKKRE